MSASEFDRDAVVLTAHKAITEITSLGTFIERMECIVLISTAIVAVEQLSKADAQEMLDVFTKRLRGQLPDMIAGAQLAQSGIFSRSRN